MKKVVKIVTFYDDGTFTESTPSPYVPSMPYMPAIPAQPYINPYPNPYPWPQIFCGVTSVTTSPLVDDPESKN